MIIKDQNPDVIESGMNPLLHYVLFGENENRNTPTNGYRN